MTSRLICQEILKIRVYSIKKDFCLVLSDMETIRHARASE